MLLSIALLPSPALAEIRGKAIHVPATLHSGDASAAPLADYWRANAKVTNDGLTDNKKDFPFVLNLIEYRFDADRGGRFELQAKYIAREPCLAQLRVNGDEVANLFNKPVDHSTGWTPLGSFSLRTGTNFLRFTSRYVETPFPLIKAMRLIYHGGPVPPPEPKPVVRYPRSTLARDWYKSVSRKIHCDFHTPGYVRDIGKSFDVDEYGRTLEQAGANAIVVFGKGRHGYAYYNTRVGTRHPGLNFDLLAKQIEACHKRNIAIWAYLSVGEEELFTSTLEQTVADPKKRSIKIKPEMGGAYERYEITPMIRELICEYDLDGLFIDFPESEEFVQRITHMVKSLRPGMIITFNHQWVESRERHAHIDIEELESWNHKMAFYHWQYFARYLHGSVPLTAMAVSFWRSWGDFGRRTDEANLRFQVATGQANGCLITIGDHLHPFGRLNPVVYDRIGRVLRDARQVEPYVIDSESVPYVALHRPGKVELCSIDDDCRALIDSAIHFSIIDPTQDPSPYKAFIIPDAAVLEPAETARLERYVREGGRLVLMGQPNDALAKLAGIRIAGEPEPAYIHVDPKILPTLPAMDVYSDSDIFPVQPLGDTKVLAPLVWQLGHDNPYCSRRHAPPDDKVSGLAAITRRTVGKGQVVYIGAPILKVYASWGYTAMREILADLIEYIIPPAERLLDVEADVPLEVSLTRQGERLIVHLVHCPQSRIAASSWNKEDYTYHQPIIQGMPTVKGVTLRMPADLIRDRKFHLITGNEYPPCTTREGLTTLTVPDFKIRAVLVIE